MNKMKKPEANEYHAFYQGYVDLVKEIDILPFLEGQLSDFVNYMEGLEEQDMTYAYADNKWTVAEVIGHIIDTERVMAYRTMCFSRLESAPLPGFDQEDYIRYSGYKNRKKDSLIREFQALRTANLEMIYSLSEEQLTFAGIMNGDRCTVCALIYIIAGHLQHHFNQLKTRYTRKS